MKKGAKGSILWQEALQQGAREQGEQETSAPDGPAKVALPIGGALRVGAEEETGQQPQRKAQQGDRGKTSLAKERRKGGNGHGNPIQAAAEQPAEEIAVRPLRRVGPKPTQEAAACKVAPKNPAQQIKRGVPQENAQGGQKVCPRP